jgi:hypothetical protein
MPIAGTAEFCATILSRVTTQHRTMHADSYVRLTMGLDRRRRERVSLRISLQINARTPLVLYLEAMLVSTAM